jgi:hypothetical protein
MTDDLIRPMWTRVGEAGMNLAGFPVEQPPLRWAMPLDAQMAVAEHGRQEVPEPVREQVVREALADADTYHCGTVCPHAGGEARDPHSIPALGLLVCEFCAVAENMDDPMDVPTRFRDQTIPDDLPCVLCGAAEPLLYVRTQTGDEEHAMLYHTHCCLTCASWWPAPEHADVMSVSASVGGRPAA